MNSTLIGICLLVANYLIGSISSAVIITRLVKKQDIREIGDRKAGGSNVIKNVGLIWGLLVGAFDIIKGVPLLILARNLDIDESWLSFIAIAAVIGHNWPLYFNFAGGRGIATIIGTILYLTPSGALIPLIIFAFSIIPALIKQLKNFKPVSSPILTLIALAVYIFMTFQTDEKAFQLYSVLILVLVLFRRITARIKEYRNNSLHKLLLSRLLFDNDYSL
ncbi:MAG: glycerol-3-phosphate acyltransferase [Patescibacteria group bacterium]|nr:glycerol-3-phosphate acyltransferase [Patescibacteria group bacterium]